jgi:hypothetical protein
MSGPPPKRDAERRRRNRKDVETTTVKVDELIAQPVEIPEAPEHWHETATYWFESLARSGQAVFYEPSDWSLAYILAENLSRELKPQVIGLHPETGEIQMATVPMKGASLNAMLKGMTALMVAEGDRRRLSIELERKRSADAAAAAAAGIPDISQTRARRLAGGNRA